MVIISNGFCKFHLAPLASEMSKRGALSAFVTGAYPTPRIIKLISALGLSKRPSLARLFDRIEPIPQERIITSMFPEALYQASMFIRKYPALKGISFWLNGFSFRLYGSHAKRVFRRVDPTTKIYHYRAGMGHSSVQLARKHGLVTLCDHSIAHPAVVDYLIENGGVMPARDAQPEISAIESTILQDIDQADAVIVNSDFVKSTFLNRGWDPKRVHVVYLGVDDAFLDKVPERVPVPPGSSLRLLFAGHFASRKGGEILAAALRQIHDLPWQLRIAGAVSPELRVKMEDFFNDSRVTLLGTLTREQLANTMAESDVLVFPSLAEGSARVVFEALASGCYVITTPNTGSIVEDGVHGALVSTGSVEELERAIRDAIESGESVSQIGLKNRSLIRTSYRQTHYGDAVLELYNSLVQRNACS